VGIDTDQPRREQRFGVEIRMTSMENRQ